ncbi:hypothetical protein GHT06_017201 [Daphnia sinensis]|uniref:PDZ domain-containing protein n=1 Tax=Daphnia sinensis TaxID=1820382 RepID=A0AAD5LGS1_9CRUS|nr:hypothetical protein GHT06_017201 [Daphnia sinensis]
MQVHLIGGRASDLEDMDMDQHQHNHVGFSQRRNASLQRSQDSGALTDWSAGSRASPTRQSCHSLERDDSHKYVTVLSVNGGLNLQSRQVQPQNDHLIQSDPDDFVTVLSIGSRQTKNHKEDEDEEEGEESEPVSMAVGSVCLSLSGFVEEVACVTRRPGQKLGFGLKFDGGNECDLPIQRLFVQCCAEGSPASNVRCSWGRLVEADEIIEIGGVDIRNTLNRLQVVGMLKDSQQDVLSLKIRHYWDESKRTDIMEQLNSACSTPKPAVCHPVVDSKPPVTRKMSTRQQQQERAVDVPEELLTQSVMRTGQRPTAWKGHPLIDEPPPPVPPRRKRRSKLAHTKSTVGSTSKTIICRSLSSDEVLVNGNRVTASGAVAAATPSKPPRNHRPPHSRSFNATHSSNNNSKDDREMQEVQAPATLPRTKEFIGQQLAPPEPKERTRRNTLLTINADWCAPQPAEVYTNLIAEEDKRLMSIDTCSATESESESSSSVSTVVDNWSVVSSTSGGDPFGDFSEQEEYREFCHQPADEKRANKMIIEQQQMVPDVVPGESTLSVLIEPPETFLDEGPTSISPTLSSEENLHHQDASSDSGASSGGSELHLGESDEELRAFQQMENALETEKLEQTRNAISDATTAVGTNSTSGDIERPETPIQQSAICVPDTRVQENDEPPMECPAEKPVKRSSSSSRKEGVHKKTDLANGISSNANNKNKTGSKLNLNRTPLRSKIPQAVSTPPPATRPASAIPSVRNGRPMANNKASNIAGPRVVNKTSTSSNNIAIRQQNHYNSSIQSSRMLSTKATPTISQQRIGSNENKSTVASASSSTNLLKSVKPGLAQPAIHGSRIPRPSSSSGPAKSSPSAATARLASHASSSSSAMLAHRHPSSPSLLLQANNRTTATTTSGVKSCIPSHLHKSTSRLHLTHNNKGESSLIRSDLVSAH